MSARRWAALLSIALAASLVPACAEQTASPAGTVVPTGDCTPDLPPRTSPEAYPVAVLHVNGEDLPPLLGAVTYRAGSEPVGVEAPQGLNYEMFLVSQVRGLPQFSIRMTDDVQIATWEVYAMRAAEFRTSGLEAGERVSWGTGLEVVEQICLPLVEGDWLIGANLTFADDAGEGDYYWRLNVAEVPVGG